MATLDDGVQNLQRFIGKLTAAVGALQQVTDHLEGCAREATEIDALLTQHAGGLNDDLEHAGEQLDRTQAEALQALASLTQTATASQHACDEKHERAGQAADHFASTVDALSTRLQDELGHLTQAGFEKLGQDVAHSESSLESAGQESEHTWTELEAGIAALEAEAQPAWDAADTALADGAADAESGGATLETEGAACVQAFEGDGAELEGACTSLSEELQSLYEGCEQGVDTQCGELIDALHHLAEEAVKHVEAGGQEQLDDPVGLVETEGLDAVSAEYAQLEAWVTAAEPMAGTVAALAEELPKCKAVVGEVDQLMNALAG